MTNTNTTHRPSTFQCEVMRVGVQPLQGGCVGHQCEEVSRRGNSEEQGRRSTALNVVDLGLVFLDYNCRSLGADWGVRGRGGVEEGALQESEYLS